MGGVGTGNDDREQLQKEGLDAISSLSAFYFLFIYYSSHLRCSFYGWKVRGSMSYLISFINIGATATPQKRRRQTKPLFSKVHFFPFPFIAGSLTSFDVFRSEKRRKHPLSSLSIQIIRSVRAEEETQRRGGKKRREKDFLFNDPAAQYGDLSPVHDKSSPTQYLLLLLLLLARPSVYYFR